jgi:hypothetical protein
LTTRRPTRTPCSSFTARAIIAGSLSSSIAAFRRSFFHAWPHAHRCRGGWSAPTQWSFFHRLRAQSRPSWRRSKRNWTSICIM